jgi:cytoskeletal protein CcmA (bactofilin family)
MGQEDLYLDGEIEGVVELPENRFVVGKSGKVQANIKAKEVDVLGTVHGDIIAGERITIRRDATLVGNLKSSTISIEDGAFFKGSIDIVRPAPVKAAPPAPPPPPPPAPVARPSATPPASSGPTSQVRNR